MKQYVKHMVTVFCAVIMCISMLSFNVSAQESKDTKSTHCHVWTWKVSESDSTGQYTVTISCKLCDKSYTYKLPHLHRWTIDSVEEPTCTEDGSIVFKCKDCDESCTKVIPATGHNFGDEWEYDENGHWHVCTKCGVKDSVYDHNFGDWVIDQEPTETEDGSQYRECGDCGYTEKDIIPATGNSDNTDDGSDSGSDTEPDDGCDTGDGSDSGSDAGTNDNEVEINDGSNSASNAETGNDTDTVSVDNTASDSSSFNAPQTGDNATVFYVIVLGAVATTAAVFSLLCRRYMKTHGGQR